VRQRTLLPCDSTESGALFSKDRLYRYKLWRRWSDGPTLCWLMLNPSSADEISNDPTVERCERRTRQMGYGQIVVLNIYAYRATDPAELWKVADPVGPMNDGTILIQANLAGRVVCAWGNNSEPERAAAVVAMLRAKLKIELFHLGLTGAGQPKHPLYVPYSIKPTPWAP